MDPTKELLILQSPRSPSEWDAYFDLRWRILASRGGQPRGSKRDSEDDSAFHLPLMDAAGTALPCGRLHLTARGRGAAGNLLNARDNAVEFYRKRGYGIIGDGETLFGVIRHVRIAKLLQ